MTARRTYLPANSQKMKTRFDSIVNADKQETSKAPSKDGAFLMQYEHIPEFDDHARVVYLNNPQAKLRGFIAIHRSREGIPSFGATRLWKYDSEQDALKDALRLSRTMSYKLAAANLPYGGAKAALLLPDGDFDRELLLKAYAEEVEKLKGAFVTGTDVGVTNDDVKLMKSVSPHFVGLSVDPAIWTAKGVFLAIEATLNFLSDDGGFSNKTVAIQGVGKVGAALTKMLVDHGAHVIISDINNMAVDALNQDLGGALEVVDVDKIHTVDAHVFAPCALSGSINVGTVDLLRVKAVVGCANNQLTDASMAVRLYNRGIIYVPDFVSNAGGLISVVDEYEHGSSNTDRLAARLEELKSRVGSLLADAKKGGVPPLEIATKMYGK